MKTVSEQQLSFDPNWYCRTVSPRRKVPVIVKVVGFGFDHVMELVNCGAFYHGTKILIRGDFELNDHDMY